MGNLIIRDLDKIVDIIENLPMVSDITGLGKNNEIDESINEIYGIVLDMRKELRNGNNSER